ncbi:MAG: DUF5117 domain-containing protein, partial [Bacteroidales bacterium]|nr:DUF5117 domain-containing protein [Bacteroidales bacterium]
MKRSFIIVAAIMMATASLTLAQPRGGRPGPGKPDSEKKDEPEKPAPELKFTAGLFGVANHEKDWYFEVPDNILGRRILAVTRYVSNTPGSSQYGGEEVNEAMIYWEKASNGNLILRVDALTIQADDGQDIQKAVKVSSENPIIASIKPEKSSTPGSTRVKVTNLFEGDLQAFSLSSGSKRQMNLGGVKGDASFIESVRTYPINTEITVTKTFTYNQPTPSFGGGNSSPMRTQSLPAGREAGTVTFVLNTSMVLLPETPMQPRLFDARVGYFADGYSKFTDEQQGVENLRFITRWRLEARPEDVEKQKRGELVEPVKPIIYYIDPATPKQWRPYL